ncbi:YtxH domain-containing protein [Wukongibacter sp. M2B1]|uniref:YtxH domain-containing protein n=1 Tax=Wukongibacter sp. M2B1 TaxID=3088895 RepID=UPI003D7905A6
MFDFIRRRELRARKQGFSQGITIGALVGGFLGGITAILTAPDSGENTRKKLQESAVDIKNNIEEDLNIAKDKINDEIAQSIEWLRKEISEAKQVFSKEDLKEELSMEVIESDSNENTL